MRAILACLTAVVALPALAEQIIMAPEPYSPPRNTVYLDDSKVYDAIREKDPARYEKIIGVLRVAQAEPCETLPKILKTQYEVNASCAAYQVYTSYPAKTLLNFTVEDTNYVAFVVQPKLSGGKLIPAK
jgi:hypothetical protein